MFRPDLTTLRLFLAVYNFGNISKASEREHIAPSAISKRIQSFEIELGTQLFYRHARGVTPTPAGRVLATFAQKMFEDVNRVAADLSGYSTGSRGEVRIHAHSSAVIQYLPAQLAEFLRTYSHVQVMLREETSLSAIQSMLDGVADIIIIDGNVPVPPGLSVLPYVSDTLIALFPANHPLAERSSVALTDIRDSDHVSLETGSSLQILVAQAAETMGFQLKTRIEVRTFEAAVRMVEVGLGVAVLPTHVIRNQAENDKVRIVALSDDWAVRDLVICIRQPTVLTASAKLMLEHLTAVTSRSAARILPNRDDAAAEAIMVPLPRPL